MKTIDLEPMPEDMMPKRTDDEIYEAISEYHDKVWYERKLVMLELIRHGEEEMAPEEIMEGMTEAMRKIETKYGHANLIVPNDFEWGMINGKLSALRWVLGEDWDFLDT